MTLGQFNAHKKKLIIYIYVKIKKIKVAASSHQSSRYLFHQKIENIFKKVILHISLIICGIPHTCPAFIFICILFFFSSCFYVQVS